MDVILDAAPAARGARCAQGRDGVRQVLGLVSGVERLPRLRIHLGAHNEVGGHGRSPV